MVPVNQNQSQGGNLLLDLFFGKLKEQPKREVQVRQYQVIQRKDGMFARSTQIIFKPEAFKDEKQILAEQDKRIAEQKPTGSSWFRSVKVTNIRVEGNNNHVNFKF